jgi:copper(I)-binding protein
MKISTSKLILVTSSLLALFTAQLALSSEASREAPSRDRASDSPAQGMINENQLLQISNAYLKINPNGQNAAAYMTIKNNNKNEIVIESVSVSQDLASKTEMHETITEIIDEQEVKKMRAVKEFRIPALGELQLKPGASHIMLLDLTQTLSKDGKKIVAATINPVTITLNFKDNKSQEVLLEKFGNAIKSSKQDAKIDR